MTAQNFNIALLLALFVLTSVTKNDKQDAVFKNHENRLDQLENIVRGSVGQPETQESSHQSRIEELERQLQALQAETKPGDSQ